MRKSTFQRLLILILICVTAFMLFSCKEKDEKKDYVVLTFVTNCDIEIAPIVLDGKTEMSMPDDPIRAGYDFGGWFYDQIFNFPFSIADGFSTDTTLYAKWMKKQLVIDPGTVPPDSKDEAGFIYEKSDDETYGVVGYVGEGTTVSIPDLFKSLPVREICDGAFQNNKTLEEIKFGYEIHSVGKEVFKGCEKLKKITAVVGNYYYTSVDGILYNKDKTTILAAGAACELDSLNILKTVENIADSAFDGCVFDIAFVSDGSYYALDGNDFAGFKGKITLSAQITEIRKDAFYGASCEVIFSVDNGITELTNGAFASYIGEKLVLSPNIKTLTLQPFNNATAIIDLSKTGITAFGSQAFAGYKGKTLTVPMTVASLGKNCFYQCTSEIVFEDGSALNSIGEQAFSSFMGKVTFCSGITEIKDYAFYCAISSAEIIFNDEESSVVVSATAFKNCKAAVNYK